MLKHKNLYTLILTFFTLLHLNAQDQTAMPYKASIGLRLGFTEGLDVKARLNNGHAIEGILGFRPYGNGLTVLYEVYNNTNTNQLYWYYGGGMHFGWENRRNYYYTDKKKRYYTERYAGFGIDGIIGLEYKVNNAPLAFSLDIKPGINLYNDYHSYIYLDPGLGLKFTF